MTGQYDGNSGKTPKWTRQNGVGDKKGRPGGRPQKLV